MTLHVHPRTFSYFHHVSPHPIFKIHHRDSLPSHRNSTLGRPEFMKPQLIPWQELMDSDQDQTFRLVSPTFDNGGNLPRQYTNGGQGARKDLSPPLEWYNVPEGTKSLALVVEDADATSEPDGPVVPWTHWVVVNIPPSIKRLPEGLSHKEESLGREYEQIKEGHNDWKVPGWCGPVHQTNSHRIVFRLYALDDELRLGNKVTKEKLLDEIGGHVLGEAELIAVF